MIYLYNNNAHFRLTDLVTPVNRIFYCNMHFILACESSMSHYAKLNRHNKLWQCAWWMVFKASSELPLFIISPKQFRGINHNLCVWAVSKSRGIKLRDGTCVIPHYANGWLWWTSWQWSWWKTFNLRTMFSSTINLCYSPPHKQMKKINYKKFPFHKKTWHFLQ